MALKFNDDIQTAQSTGAEKFDGSAVSTEQPTDNTSTGEEKYATPGETRADHWNADVVVRDPTPGPVVMSVSWKSDAQAKVVQPAAKPAPKKSGPAKTKG